MARPDLLPDGMGAYGARETAADARRVERFHDESDSDNSRTSQHHSLGTGANQAAPGNHTHNGKDSELLWEGVSISGSRGGNLALASVIAALVRKGAVDNTTA